MTKSNDRQLNDKGKMTKFSEKYSRRKALLLMARFLAAIGLTSLGIRLVSPGKDKVLLDSKSICKGCHFEQNTCVPSTTTCRRAGDKK